MGCVGACERPAEAEDREGEEEMADGTMEMGAVGLIVGGSAPNVAGVLGMFAANEGMDGKEEENGDEDVKGN